MRLHKDTRTANVLYSYFIGDQLLSTGSRVTNQAEDENKTTRSAFMDAIEFFGKETNNTLKTNVQGSEIVENTRAVSEKLCEL